MCVKKQKMFAFPYYLGSPPVLWWDSCCSSVFCGVFLFLFCLSSFCVYCCPCLWIVHYWLLPPFSLVFIDNEVRNALSIILLKKITNRRVHLRYFRYMNRYKHTNSASTTEMKKRTVFTFVFILQIHPIRMTYSLDMMVW